VSEPYRVRRASNRRLTVIVALVAAMTLTLVARLYWVDLLDPHPPSQTAGRLHNGDIVIPAPRGNIVDARGRALVRDTSTQVLTVDRMKLLAQPDHGARVLSLLAWLLGTSPVQLAQEITPCSPKVSAPCWTGEPFQPVPVMQDVSTTVALAVSEHREQFPGVALQTVTEPQYPGGSLAAHVLGYTGSVNGTDEKANP